MNSDQVNSKDTEMVHLCECCRVTGTTVMYQTDYNDPSSRFFICKNCYTFIEENIDSRVERVGG